MALTPRQRTFLSTLSDLCQKAGGPVHYADLASEMGVSPFSAYDMLRLLEGKGAVISEYVLDPGRSGPGRSRVVFRPASKARQLLHGRSLPRQRLGEAMRFQEQMLRQLRELREREYGEFARELLASLPRRRSPLLYCTETLVALLATLADLREGAAHSLPLDVLSSLAASGGEVLGLGVGLSLGSLLGQTAGDSEVTEKLLRSAKRYQQYLSNLSDEAKAGLSEFFRQAINTVATGT